MKLKEKLILMHDIEKRNQERIKNFSAKPRKRPSIGFKEKTEDNMATPKKPK